MAAAPVTGAGVAAAAIAAAVLLPADFLARGAGRLAIALLGASAGVLAWCLRRAWAAAVRARRDARTTVAEARGVRRVERLLAQLPDAVVAVDPRGVVCVANTAAGELLGVR
ncbi:MAG: PAS domain-containing protein, partial [Spirochaetaceae bacterium]|nr:PAS domain-containing protein [Spirochaetaceae bacterium]